jgi:hypothetical protein
MRREAPSWVRKLAAGRAAALAAMTPEEIAARQVEIKERIARRSKRLADARLVSERMQAGDTPDEIAAALGIAPRNLFNRAKRWGFTLMRRKGFRWLSSWVRESRIPALDCLAADLGVTRAVALERILDASLEKGAFVARRTLGFQRKVAA